MTRLLVIVPLAFWLHCDLHKGQASMPTPALEQQLQPPALLFISSSTEYVDRDIELQLV